MITRIHIQNYRMFKKLDFEPKEGLNIIVGNNEAGKSTLLEAITLVLNGRLNGRWVSDELNPYWFNTEVVNEYFKDIKDGKAVVPPTIIIEVYFGKNDEPQKYCFSGYLTAHLSKCMTI
ncbi:MAG: ATP-binding protein [Bacillota bacterium]|nr:ATP-binding protein [Bacillota bacterium]